MSNSNFEQVQKAWKSLEQWQAKNSTSVSSLRPGASSTALKELEDTIELKLPADLVQSLSIHDGDTTDEDAWKRRQEIQAGKEPVTIDRKGVVCGLQLLSVREIIEQWILWRSVEQDWDDTDDEYESQPSESISTKYCCKGHIPLAHDFGGNYIGVDLMPGPNGKRGQVITFGRDEDPRFVVADNWAQFLTMLASDVQSAFRCNSEEEIRDPSLGNEPFYHYSDFLKDRVESRR
ncbi:MAG TPA: SMI1/KNR4 family protein [Oculatellaceae cyanobacterium]